jgi:hypothetical protein
LKKNYFSSHKLPKQQSTSFWSQGILEVKGKSNIQHHHEGHTYLFIRSAVVVVLFHLA